MIESIFFSLSQNFCALVLIYICIIMQSNKMNRMLQYLFYIILNLSTYQQLISTVEVIFLVFVLGTGDVSFTDHFFLKK